jgi:hypothetical protein
MVALAALIFWLLNFPFMLMVCQEPMILQWAKVVTVIPLTINSHDNFDEDYRPGPQDEEELRSRNTSEHNMGLAGCIMKLEQWEEEDRQLVVAGIPNPYDAYPDDRSKNLL